MNEPQIVELGAYSPGTRLDLTNGLKAAIRYTFDCGEYGSISFVLAPGAELRFTPGTVAPKIETHDAGPGGIRLV